CCTGLLLLAVAARLRVSIPHGNSFPSLRGRSLAFRAVCWGSSLPGVASQRRQLASRQTNDAQPFHRADVFQRASPAGRRRSCQTLGLARVKCEACLCTQSRFIEALQSVAARRIGSSSSSCVASERAVRPLAAGEPAYRATASCSIGLGCPSFGGQRTSGSVRTHAQAKRGLCSA